jgi:hypothetical protein
MKSGVISLIYKKKGDRRCIRNYRNTSPNPNFSKTLNIYSWLSLSKAFSWSAFIIYPSGISIPLSDKVAKMFQHADDTTVTVSNKQSIDEVFNILELYGKCSGARINKSKSEIMLIGKGCITESEQQRYIVFYKMCSVIPYKVNTNVLNFCYRPVRHRCDK